MMSSIPVLSNKKTKIQLIVRVLMQRCKSLTSISRFLLVLLLLLLLLLWFRIRGLWLVFLRRLIASRLWSLRLVVCRWL
jgi:hypothetical protein